MRLSFDEHMHVTARRSTCDIPFTSMIGISQNVASIIAKCHRTYGWIYCTAEWHGIIIDNHEAEMRDCGKYISLVPVCT